MKIPVKAKIRNSKGGKHPNWVICIPAAYINNGLLVPGREYSVEIEAQPVEERIEKKNGLAGIRTQIYALTESGAPVYVGALKAPKRLTTPELQIRY